MFYEWKCQLFDYEAAQSHDSQNTRDKDDIINGLPYIREWLKVISMIDNVPKLIVWNDTSSVRQIVTHIFCV